MSKWSVVWLDGSERGVYCGEFSPDEEAMALELHNRIWNVCHKGAKAIGAPVRGGIAVYGSEKTRLAEFKLI